MMVEVSQHSFGLCSDLVKLRSVARMPHSQSCLGCAESLQKDQQSYEDNGSSPSEVENPNGIYFISCAASVSMHDFDSKINN